MPGCVTSKGQVTIPKALRDQFGIEPGAKVDFSATADGIRLRRVVDRSGQSGVLGCLKSELRHRDLRNVMDDLRGAVEIPRRRAKAPRA